MDQLNDLTARAIALLGINANDIQIDTLLFDLSVKRRPMLKQSDYDDGITKTWLPIKRIGIEFGFMNRSTFNATDGDNLLSAPLLFMGIIFYGGRPDIKKYEGKLPFDITFDDERASVREKMSKVAATLKSYQRDVWYFESYQVIVSYNEARKVEDLHYYLIPKASPRREPIELPTGDLLGLVVGREINDKAVHDTFSFIDFQTYLRKLNTDKALDLASLFGLHLKLEGEACHEQKGVGTIVSVITLYRDRFLDYTYEWKGALPFGIRFDDSPEEFFSKIPYPPEKVRDSFLEGHAYWIFENYSMKIVYSTFMNDISKIYIVPRDYYND